MRDILNTTNNLRDILKEALRAGEHIDAQCALHLAVESATQTLPELWTINVHIDRNCATVELTDPEGNLRAFPTNYDTLATQVKDATALAIRESNAAPAE